MRLLVLSLTVALLAACGSGGVGADSGTSPSEIMLDSPDGPFPYEWDSNPCRDFVTDLTSDIDEATAAARHGLDPETSVPGSGEITGYGCMAGSDTGLEAIVVHRRVGDEVYSDYVIADGGAAMDWEEWFEVTQPETEIRPFEYGWTNEPEGLSERLPAQTVWAKLAEAIATVNDEIERLESSTFDP